MLSPALKTQVEAMPKIDNMHMLSCKGANGEECEKDVKYLVKEYVISVQCPECYKKSKAS